MDDIKNELDSKDMRYHWRTHSENIKDALLQCMEIDLDNPTCFGQTVCNTLSEEWDPIKPK